MGKADLHVHTTHGDGMASVAELLDYVEQCTDLSVLAITEHDDFGAAEEARNRHARGHYRFDLVAGMEVTTLEGHLLALFIERPVASFRGLARTVEAVRAQGGICVVPHPMNPLTRSIGRNGLHRIQRHPDPTIRLDGIELHSHAPAWAGLRQRTDRLNADHWRLAAIGASDAHFLPVIGSAFTQFPGRSAADLKQAVLDRTTVAGRSVRPSLSAIGYRTVARQQWRGIWATPRKVGGRAIGRLRLRG